MSEFGPTERFLERLAGRHGENAEILREFRSHLEESTIAYEELGMSREDAEEEAVRSLGRVEAEKAVREESRRPLVTLGWRGQEGVFWRAFGVVFGAMVWTIVGGFRRRVAASWHIPAAVYAAFAVFVLFFSSFAVFRPGDSIGVWRFESEFQSRWQEHYPHAVLMEEEGRFFAAYRKGGNVEAVRKVSGTDSYPLPNFPVHMDEKRLWTDDKSMADRQWAEKVRRMPRLSEQQLDHLYSIDGEYERFKIQFFEQYSFPVRLLDMVTYFNQFPWVIALIGLGANLLGATAGRIVEDVGRRKRMRRPLL